MAFQAVPNAVEISMIFTQNGETCQNNFQALLPGGYLLADLQALATQIDINWQGNWRSEQPPEVTYVRTEVRGLAVPNDLIASDNTSSNPGLYGGTTLPNQVTFSIKRESGLTGRSARGRCYWIGVPQAEVEPLNENMLKAPFAALIVANVDTVRTSIAAVGLWEPVIVSRFANGLARSPGITFPWVSTTNVNLVLDTQRGRLPK